MGYKIVYPDDISLPICIESSCGSGIYDPLHDDAQAMALLKKFQITTLPQRGKWSAVCAFTASELHDDLNRAICECVAKMQNAKVT